VAIQIWLGPSGAEVLLPPLSWMSGEPSEYPETFKQNYDSAVMLDGRIRYDFKSHSQRSWTLGWAWLTRAQVETIQGLADLRQSLHFRNGLMPWTAWATVAIVSFTPILLMTTVRPGSTPRYKAEMALGEGG
jgi:hypothetical protein